jgi:hypothetical protein
MLVSRILDTIIFGLLDFVGVFIMRVGEQDAKIALQKEKLDMVKADLSRIERKFNENIEKYHKNLDNLANKLIVSKEQDIRPINNEVRNSMYLGGKTRRHRKYIKLKSFFKIPEKQKNI